MTFKKITYQPNPYNTLSFLVISGSSLYERTKEDAMKEEQVNYGRRQNNQSTIGMNYKKIWNESSFKYQHFFQRSKSRRLVFELQTSSVTSMANNTLQSFLRQINKLKFQINLELSMGLRPHLSFAVRFSFMTLQRLKMYR